MKKYFMKFGDIVWGVIILLSILLKLRTSKTLVKA